MRRIFLLASIVVLCPRGATAQDSPVASIRLHNLTSWDAPTVVEVPTGRIAAPRLVDWANVRLVSEGKEIPFAVREGRAHWKARLTAPVGSPRAEDLLVFSCAVPPGEWMQVDLVEGKPDGTSALARENGQIRVEYPHVEAVIDETTGLLMELSVFDEQVLERPLSMVPYKLKDDGYKFSGHFGPGYSEPTITYAKDAALPFETRLVSSSSTPAMTELNFVHEIAGGLVLSLTLRIHASGEVEIWADDRSADSSADPPGRGKSPWLDHAVEYDLELRGEEKLLPFFENRFGFFGFKHFTATVKFTGSLHSGEPVGTLEIGEETVNGRRWMRKLYPFRRAQQEKVDSLVEMADEGLIVAILPKRSAPLAGPVEVVGAGSARIAAERLVGVLAEAGVEAKLVLEPEGTQPIRFELFDSAAPQGIEGDGFAIRPAPASGFSIRAGTVLGFSKAVADASYHMRKQGGEVRLPLIARNPIVGFRAVGMGGGPFEVDFPYATDDEWERVFGHLIDAGVNVISCLSMWGNWKMPVSYKYIPELQSDDPDAHDQAGTPFSEIETHREHGLKLARYLRDRGVEVWLELMIGVAPYTFAEQFPDALAPGKHGASWGKPNAIPCFSHATYHRYLDAFMGEILDTYPIDGFWFARDDNGVICDCERCEKFIAGSRTKNPVWEQHLLLYDWLREHGFQGDIGVYPYMDRYDASVEPLLPEDLYIVGHGCEAAGLFRDYETIGFMPDTWLDNVYLFKIAASPRMRRLLSDRGTFWCGGAYVGTELQWESVGYFGWEPTATPNSFRYQWGVRNLGEENALLFVRMNDAYEHLWEILSRYLLPRDWIRLDSPERQQVVEEGRAQLRRYETGLAALKKAVGEKNKATWFGHLDVFPPYLEYMLGWLDTFARMHELTAKHRDVLTGPGPLPAAVREEIVAGYKEVYSLADKYQQALQGAPGKMLAQTLAIGLPNREWYAGFDGWIEPHLQVPRFAGDLTVTMGPLRAGEEFTLSIELHNQGMIPWVPGVGLSVVLSGVAASLGLPPAWAYEGDLTAPGDRRRVELRGVVPEEPGEGELELAFLALSRAERRFIEKSVRVEWK